MGSAEVRLETNAALGHQQESSPSGKSRFSFANQLPGKSTAGRLCWLASFSLLRLDSLPVFCMNTGSAAPPRWSRASAWPSLLISTARRPPVRLSASIAHELNQPLGAILSNAETLELMLESRTPDMGRSRLLWPISSMPISGRPRSFSACVVFSPRLESRRGIST